MNLNDATNILLIHDLEYFAEQIPAGLMYNDVLKEVIERSDGAILDRIAQKHFGLVRNVFTSYIRGVLSETDVDFRERILISLGLNNQIKACTHSWIVYDSGWSRYEFCSKCDVKNVQS